MDFVWSSRTSRCRSLCAIRILFFLALELFVGFIFLMWTSYFIFGGKMYIVFMYLGNRKGIKMWQYNVKLHI